MKKQQNCHSTSMGTWGCSPEGGRGWGTGGVNRSASTDDNLTSSPGGNSPGTWTHVCVSSKWMDEGRRGAPCWRHQPLLWRLCHSPADADAPTPPPPVPPAAPAAAHVSLWNIWSPGTGLVLHGRPGARWPGFRWTSQKWPGPKLN